MHQKNSAWGVFVDACRLSLIIASQHWFSTKYFSTREGAPIGPYDNKREAVRGLDDFLEFMTLAEPKTLSRLYANLTA